VVGYVCTSVLMCVHAIMRLVRVSECVRVCGGGGYVGVCMYACVWL